MRTTARGATYAVTFSDEITTLALELAKSLWAELGVGGSQYRHDWQAIDLEPLIIFTASLARADDAFVARTTRWCSLNSSWISIVRLRNLSPRFCPATRDSLHAFLGPTGEAASSKKRNKRSGHTAHIAPGEWPDLKRPALLQLRLRALVGGGARAEVLKLMLAEPDEPKSAAEIAQNAAFGTHGCNQALDALSAAGVLNVEPAGDVFMYRLARPSDLTMAVNGVPVAFPDWIAVLTTIDAIREYAVRKREDRKGEVAAARELTATLRKQFGRLGFAAEVPDIQDETSVTAFERWARLFVADHSGATLRTDLNEASYSVHRLALGGQREGRRRAGAARGEPRVRSRAPAPDARWRGDQLLGEVPAALARQPPPLARDQRLTRQIRRDPGLLTEVQPN